MSLEAGLFAAEEKAPIEVVVTTKLSDKDDFGGILHPGARELPIEPSSLGHNEIAVRLGILANDAKVALDRVAAGEIDAIEGWISYGNALNEGRALFHPEDDKGFGQWKNETVLSQVGIVKPKADDEIAAMWAAANPDQFVEARTAGNARTVRGIYAKWNEINAEKAAAEARAAAEKARKEAEAKAAVEAEARRKEQEARDEEARKAAVAAREKAEKERKDAEKKAKSSENKAKTAQKKADKAKAGVVTSDKDTIVSKFTGDQESYTPAKYVDAARVVMGQIDVDPASNPLAQETVKAGVWYDKETNGLDKEWTGTVFLNPPYSHPEIAHFIEKLCSEYAKGNVPAAVLLTNNNTDTKWWVQAAKAASAICLTTGRINFYKADGSETQPTNGQSFFYLGNDPDSFTSEFSQFGLIVKVIS